MPSIFDMTSSQHRQRVCVLGSTGSVGLNTLDVIAHHPERYEVFALSAMSRVDELFAQCVQWRPCYALMPDRQAAQQLRARLHDQGLRTEVMDGAAALADIAAHPEIDVVMAAIVGAAGLEACLAAARAGKRLLLANKEALVVGGAVFMQAVKITMTRSILISSPMHPTKSQDDSKWVSGFCIACVW